MTKMLEYLINGITFRIHMEDYKFVIGVYFDEVLDDVPDMFVRVNTEDEVVNTIQYLVTECN